MLIMTSFSFLALRNLGESGLIDRHFENLLRTRREITRCDGRNLCYFGKMVSEKKAGKFFFDK
jgi:hypothetical protein